MNSPGTKFGLPYTGSTSLAGKISILNISTTSLTKVSVTSTNNAYLVFSDAPENVDGDVLALSSPTALYMDQSGKIQGAFRVLMFHNNRLDTTSGVWFGVTIYNPNSYPCEVRLFNRSSAAASKTSGAGNGISVLESWFDNDNWSYTSLGTLPADSSFMVWETDTDYEDNFVLLAQFGLFSTSSGNKPAPVWVKTWAQRGRVGYPETTATWRSHLAGWHSGATTSAHIRATIPHSELSVTATVEGGKFYFLDIDSEDPSGGSSANTPPPTSKITSAGFPLLAGTYAPLWCNYVYVPSSQKGWEYVADPLGFNQVTAAQEYRKGWDWADQHSESSSVTNNPSTGFYYKSTLTHTSGGNVFMKEYNYGEFGVDLNVTIKSSNGESFQVGVTPAYHSVVPPWTSQTVPGRGTPWVWYDKTDNTQRSSSSEDPAMGEVTVMHDSVTSYSFITSLTPGGTAPLRIVITPEGYTGYPVTST